MAWFIKSSRGRLLLLIVLIVGLPLLYYASMPKQTSANATMFPNKVLTTTSVPVLTSLPERVSPCYGLNLTQCWGDSRCIWDYSTCPPAVGCGRRSSIKWGCRPKTTEQIAFIEDLKANSSINLSTFAMEYYNQSLEYYIQFDYNTFLNYSNKSRVMLWELNKTKEFESTVKIISDRIYGRM